MRLHNKYKSYNELTQIFEKFPLRILKFKSTKWKKIQKILSFKLPKKTSISKISYKSKKFKDNLLVKVNYKTWEKIKRFYQSGRKITNLLFNIFDQSISTTYLKKNILNSKTSCEILNIYQEILLKPEFKLNILLWRLNIFCSSFQASQAIYNKKVQVNDKFVAPNFVLSKGDIISLKSKIYEKNIHIKKSKSNFSPSDVILSFIEIDYYSNNIVLLKNLKDLSQDDFYLIRTEFCNIKKIKDYI